MAARPAATGPAAPTAVVARDGGRLPSVLVGLLSHQRPREFKPPAETAEPPELVWEREVGPSLGEAGAPAKRKPG
jgi:hypothetical protein